MDRTLIDYLPQILKDVREYKYILGSQEVEIKGLWTALDNALKDQFIADSTLNGVQRWEKILKVAPKPSDTLADRRFRILARLNEQLPYTFRGLEDRLDLLCGEEGYTLALDHNGYTLVVRVELVVKKQYDAVASLLQRIVPANLAIDLELRYNQYLDLTDYDHAHLGLFTHDELRNTDLSSNQ